MAIPLVFTASFRIELLQPKLDLRCIFVGAPVRVVTCARKQVITVREISILFSQPDDARDVNAAIGVQACEFVFRCVREVLALE